MNTLNGKIVKIATSGEIGQVYIDVNGEILTSILLDVNTFGVTLNDEVKLLFKANEVMIATKESQVSAKNAFVGKINKINKGLILSEVTMEFQNSFIKSIITTASLETLNIKENSSFLWFVKANEVTLQKEN
jgi:molybdopterin-binding protein